MAKRAIFAGCLLCFVTIACFWPARNFDFLHFDDDINIFLNPHLGTLDATTIHWLLTDMEYMRRYIPAGWAGLATLYGLFGLDPHGYHMASILLHGINALLVTAVCREIIKKAFPEKASSIWIEISSTMAGAWWALNPMRVETVAWVSGYLYIQALFFSLASLYIYINQENRKNFSRTRMALSITLYILSLATYPLALAFPAVLLVWEAARLQQAYATDRLIWKSFKPRLYLVLGGFGLPAAMFGVVAIYATLHAGAFWQVDYPKSANIWGSPARAAYAWGYYFWRPWWPFGSRLIQGPADELIWREKDFWFCVIVFLVIVGFFFNRCSLRCGCWTIGSAHLALLVPMLGIIERPFFRCDRYAYLGSIPVTIGIGIVLAAAIRPLVRWTAAGFFALLLCGWFILARTQLPTWANSGVFLGTALRQGGPSQSHFYLMLADALRWKGRYGEAREVCARGLKQFPSSKELTRQWQNIEQTAADSEAKARWLGLTSPVTPLAYGHVIIAGQKIQRSEWREAADHLHAALEVSPQYYPARLQLAEVLVRQGEPDEALSCYLQAVATSNGHLSNAAREKFLFMLAKASALNGEERLAKTALQQAQELHVHSIH